MRTRVIVAILCLASTNQVFAKSCKELFIGLTELLQRSNPRTQVVDVVRPQALSASQVDELMAITDNYQIYQMDDSVKLRLREGLLLHADTTNEDRFRSFVIFMETLTKKETEFALSNMHKVAQGEYEGVLKRFAKVRKVIQKQREKEIRSQMKKLQRSSPRHHAVDPDVYEREMRERAAALSSDYLQKYEQNAYGCYASRWTPQRKSTSSSFAWFKTGIGAVTGGYVFATTNIDRSDDTPQRRAVQFGLELVLSFFKAKVSGAVLAKPMDSAALKMLYKYLFGRVTSTADIIIFSAILGVNDEDAQRKLQELLGSEDRVEQAKQLMTYMDRDRAIRDFKNAFMSYAKGFVGSFSSDYNGQLADDFDWSRLTEEDLERPEVQDALLAAATASIYEEDLSGDLIVTGDAGADRWAFNAAFGFFMMPRDFFVDYYLIFRTMCLGSLRPKEAMLKALAWFTLDKVLGDKIYFPSRSWAINQ